MKVTPTFFTACEDGSLCHLWVQGDFEQSSWVVKLDAFFASQFSLHIRIVN